MKTKPLILLAVLFSSISLQAQNRFFTRTGTLQFYSETPVENIEAINHQASSVFDTESGEIAVSAQMKGFEFEKALMQEHFNENYVESEKYPKAAFKGNLKNYDKSSFQIGQEYKIEVEGELTLHGVTKNVSTIATIFWGEKNIKANSSFNVSANDFNIKIPKAVIDNIAETILVQIDLNLEPYLK